MGGDAEGGKLYIPKELGGLEGLYGGVGIEDGEGARNGGICEGTDGKICETIGPGMWGLKF